MMKAPPDPKPPLPLILILLRFSVSKLRCREPELDALTAFTAFPPDATSPCATHVHALPWEVGRFTPSLSPPDGAFSPCPLENLLSRAKSGSRKRLENLRNDGRGKRHTRKVEWGEIK